MPHPERACEMAVGSEDGLVLLRSVLHALAGRGALEAATR
jgi:phosphoribosylformylglycinamidine (FGAM) synthase-like amidotransferase family enzyme